VTARGTAARRNWIVPAAIALLTLIAFLPTLSNGFVSWDDDKNFLDNAHYRGLGPSQLHWMWTTFHMGHYVPLSWMTLGFDYTLWGMNATGYHLTSLLIHCANAVFVFYVARRLFIATHWSRLEAREDLVTLGAGIAALLFAIHPLRVESVAWATERRDVLSGFFSLASLLSYLKFVGAKPVDGWTGGPVDGGYWTAVLLFACALLSKATSMSLPAVLVIVNVYPLRRLGGSAGWWSEIARRVYREIIPFGVLAAGIAVLSIVALHPPDQLQLPQKLAVSAYSLAFYLAKTLLPIRLSSLYEMPENLSALEPRFIVSYVVVAIVAVGLWLARRRWPGVVAASLAFFVITLPMLGVVQNGPQIAADRYTYHAAPALALIGAAAYLAIPRPRALISVVALVAVLGTLGTMTWMQTEVWHDPESLWMHVLEVENATPIAQSAMANIRFKANRVDEGIEFGERAVALAPRYAEAHNDLGVGYSRENRTAEAIREYRIAIQIKPKYDEAENNLGIAFSRDGQVDSAIAHFRRALDINADNFSAEINWGNALVRVDRPAESISHYEHALALEPDDQEAHLNWGVALAKLGKYPEAAIQFREVLRLNPASDDAKAYLDRATQMMSKPPGG
jgi:tetratricopeptide (TPR) repeat protein